MQRQQNNSKWRVALRRIGALIVSSAIIAAAAPAKDHDRDRDRDIFVLTSTNAAANEVVVFKLDTGRTPSLNLTNILATGGSGGASGNAGAVQFRDGLGAVVNFGSNSLTRLERDHNYIGIAGTIKLAPGCTHPVSVALNAEDAFVAGANCVESHKWPSGNMDGPVVALADSAAAQIAVGQSWAAVTITSGNGSVVQLPLANSGALAGTSTQIPLELGAGATPLGAAFWEDTLGFNPAHVPDSFALLNRAGAVSAVAGPTPPFPSNAPCWLAKGPGNIWYSANSPGKALAVFFSDSQGGAFYKSVPLAGVPTDITVAPDNRWLAVIYTADVDGLARIAVFAVDSYGDLTLAATSNPVGAITAFNGVAISN